MYTLKAPWVAGIAVMILISATGSSKKQCETWHGQNFRDCTCGVQYRDYERNCENSNTYLDPKLGQRTHICPFQCENDGQLVHLDHNHYFCRCNPGFTGICCEIETLFCGGLLLAPKGNIESHSPYYNNFHCVWKISTDPEKRIALGVDNTFPFEIEGGSSMNACDNDKVTVFDGPNNTANSLGPFCGNARPFQTIHSSGRHLYIEFKTNNDITKNGFKLKYTTYREGNRCGPRKEYRLPTAVISSPQFPLSYSSNENCEYKIFVEDNHEVVLTTLVMNLTSSADCSSGDVIEILKADVEDEYMAVTKLCSKGNYAPFTIRNTTSILLKFSSGYSTDGLFQLRYQQIPSDDYFG